MQSKPTAVAVGRAGTIPIAAAASVATNTVVTAAINAHRAEPGGLLPLLHAIQDALGHVPPAALPVIAKALNLSRAEVHGVVTFYPHFHQAPTGRHVIRICQAEACQAMGAASLMAHAVTALGLEPHTTSADGRYMLEPVYCLGNCACSPAMLIGNELHGRVDAARFDAIVAGLDGKAMQ